MKLLGSTESKITKDKNNENLLHLEITEVVLGQFNIVHNDYQHLYTIVPNKLFSQLLDITPTSFIFSNTFYLEFSYIEVWFTDQNSKPLGIEDKINITLVFSLKTDEKIVTNWLIYCIFKVSNPYFDVGSFVGVFFIYFALVPGVIQICHFNFHHLKMLRVSNES